MSLFELFIIAIGLSMDAFAVAICKGLSLNKINIKKSRNNRTVFWNISSDNALNWIFSWSRISRKKLHS